MNLNEEICRNYSIVDRINEISNTGFSEDIMQYQGNELVKSEYEALTQLIERYGPIIKEEPSFFISKCFDITIEDQHITQLSINKNKLTEIPEEINNLRQLKILSLYSNQIKKIMGLEKLTRLENLYLGNNQISEIEGVNNLKNLKILDLKYNKIEKIKGIGNLIYLKELELEKNQIEKITGLENNIRLAVLELDNNQIKEIEGIDKLTQLTRLDLDHNQIQEIKGLDKQIQLRILDLQKNPLSEYSRKTIIPQLQNKGVSVYF